MTSKVAADSAGQRPVLVVSHSYGYGGDLMYYGEIFAALRAIEPRLAIAVDRATGFANPHALDLRPLYRRHSLALPAGRGYAREIHAASPLLAVRVARMRPDVLVAVEFTPVSLLAMLGSVAVPGCRRLLLVESDPADRGASGACAVLALKRRAVAAADAILTNNEAGRRYLTERLRADPGKIEVGPYLTSRPPGPEVQIEGREGPLRLLVANGLTERKNAAVVIEALAQLPVALRQQVALTLVGDGDQRAMLEAKVAAFGLADCVRFLGHCRYGELGRHLAAADVLINPTRLDYRSLSSFEGLGYGLALLVSDRDGAARETVIEGETGFTFAPDDPRALAAHIARLAQDPALLQAMRKRALALYSDRFAVERAAANLANAIERARRA
ncbi:MAG: glycosyltransferase family 4 protein [Erythrobacter sp.]|jgi:glycosyltransferase involved in cell wall biosynthesis